MIKINIPPRINEIKRDHWKDVFLNNPTSLNITLNNTANRALLLGTSPSLHNFLFNGAGINRRNLVKIILGNKRCLEEIIEDIGIIRDNRIHEEVFCYNNFASRAWAHKLLKQLDIRVCPYCNRQYTFTIGRTGPRPQFDHYFPKSLYPYLALSFYNLIPSCPICNQAKTDHDTYNQPMLYPYESEFGRYINFETDLSKNDILYILGVGENFNVKITPCYGIYKRADTKLYLSKFYNLHKDYVKDILRNALINSDDRIYDLFLNHPDIFHSIDDLRNNIFMSYLDKDNWGKRPLSKLTHDIYQEFRIKVLADTTT